MPIIEGRLTCWAGHDLGFDADDPYADPDCAICLREDMKEDIMSEVHALFTISFPVELGEESPTTPAQMLSFFYEAMDSGYEVPLPVFVTEGTLVKLDAFIQKHEVTCLDEVK